MSDQKPRRVLHVAAAQVGPLYASEPRSEIVERLIRLLEESKRRGAELVCYPECALSTFFPRLLLDGAELDEYYDSAMPNSSVQPLFDRAKELGVGFSFGYAELDRGKRYNTSILVERDGRIVGKYRKSHIPGTAEPVPEQRWQHLERRYFLPGNTGWRVWDAFGGRVGLMICNDRRWPEAWRVLGMQDAELVLLGWNTPQTHYRKANSYSRLASFHNQLSLQAGSYQNGVWTVGVAHCGEEEPGYVLMAQSMIVSPLGEVVALSTTMGDEVIDYHIDLDAGKEIREGVFNFEVYRRPDLYKIITERRGSISQKA